MTLPSDMSDWHHDDASADHWSAHITDHWDAHSEPMHEAEPWSVHTDAGEHAYDGVGWHDAHHFEDGAGTHDMAEHGGYGDVHVDDAWHSDHGLPYELPHVHISVEPPPAGSAPLTVETDHPMAPVAPPTPPLTEQAIKDSSAAGTEAADAAMQMGA